jgi:hypothetical protein
MSPAAATQSEPLTHGREALDQLASLPVDELRRLAAVLDDEARIVRALVRERTRRPCLSREGWTPRLVTAE